MMSYRKLFSVLNTVLVLFLIGACQGPEIGVLKKNPLVFLNIADKVEKRSAVSTGSNASNEQVSLTDLLDGSLPAKNAGNDFLGIFESALSDDHIILSRRNVLNSKVAAVGSSEALKDFNVTGSVLGGIEDLTDNTKGVAVVVNASRLLYDGGALESQIDANRLYADAARLDLMATIDERALRLGEIWLELEKYETLQKQIDSRLAVLNPLIDQLEQVADAGIGDVGKVAAAQRTVSKIRVTQTDINEGLAQARLAFENAFGSVEEKISYDARFVSDLLPSIIDNSHIRQSPAILSLYARYPAGIAELAAMEARDEFKVGFEARAMRPFAGSGHDSDESIGIVVSKTLYNGGLFESELEELEALAKAGAAELRSTFREKVRLIEGGMRNVIAMDKAILLAKDEARITSDEIIYLKQQLIIGGSTLDSVLSAEARLYEAQSQEIKFLTEKRRSQLALASMLGFLGSALEM